MADMDPEALYLQLGRIIQTAPDLENPDTAEVQIWLGKVFALVEASGDLVDTSNFRSASPRLCSPRGTDHAFAKREIWTILYRRLAVAELKAPNAVQGTFIPAGNVFDALAAVAKILPNAERDVLLVDPYMDEKVLTDFAQFVPEGVSLRLLFSDKAQCRDALVPACSRWREQHKAARPLEARAARPRALHDRLIITDKSQPWLVTQSFNQLAARSPASIVRLDGEPGTLKIEAYQEMWDTAQPI